MRCPPCPFRINAIKRSENALDDEVGHNLTATLQRESHHVGTRGAREKGKREALRGVAERVLDQIFEASSSEEWVESLKAPLDIAVL